MEKITKEQFQDWFGSDHYENVNDLTDLLLEIANGEYTAQTFKSDVQDWWKANYEPQIHVETDEEYAQRVSKINMQDIEVE